VSHSKLAVGDVAPDFELQGTGAKSYKLSDYRGQPVVLVFYPGDNSPVCTLQLRSYTADLAKLGDHGVKLLAISPQGVESHDSFCEKHSFQFPLLADVDKAVARDYGILGPLGFPRRSIFIVDKEGVVAWVHRSLAGMTYKNTDEIVAAIESIGA
jgi:peroxiredoxin